MNTLPLKITRAVLCLVVSPLLFAAPAQAQEAAEGERLFKARCATCHTTVEGQNRVGPSLAGVFGRTSGSVEGARYSNAMKGANLTWDEATLETYLANPRGVVPGSTMTISVTSADQRAAIIAFLKAQAGG
ncbi:cytochrome c [Azorhizobium oxalatiphilum]|uniref:Cytochrome c n=1 Tax=Azorhizobium oxalatiphilum TaxID=980631 RepID=A0A917C7G0_9HYPH|nr:c-type cytochrome [Azorhizobium oxalatiphilum]GGF73774.1 cytochrome c [Azorhizobium oxalatiphilum]